MKNIPISMRLRSNILAFMLERSLNMMTPQMNDTMTELLLMRETTEIIESACWSELKYAKSAAEMNTEIRGIAQTHLSSPPTMAAPGSFLRAFMVGIHRMNRQIISIRMNW